jgi:hypothetical protein
MKKPLPNNPIEITLKQRDFRASQSFISKYNQKIRKSPIKNKRKRKLIIPDINGKIILK